MKDNKLIAEFMGGGKEYHIDMNTKTLKSYHTSWDWLMPVLEKIEMECQGVPIELLHCSLYSEISEVHLSVVEFIKRKNRYE